MRGRLVRQLQAVAAVAVVLCPSSAMAQADRSTPLGSIDAPDLQAMLETVGITTPLERGRALLELIRIVHRAPAEQDVGAAASRLRLAAYLREPDRTHADSVPLPLTPRFWADVVFKKSVPPQDLVSAILMDRSASLLYVGLMGLDAETLGYLAGQSSLVQAIYLRHAGTFAAFSSGIRVRGGRVVLPGGADAAQTWQTLAGESPSDTTKFMLALLERENGRLAYLYQTCANATDAVRMFLMGSPSGGVSETLKSVYGALGRADRAWEPQLRPWTRQSHDLRHVLAAIRIDPAGRVAGPSWRWLWESVYEGADPHRRAPGSGRPVDAAWLSAHLLPAERVARRDRLETFAFGQRVFGDVAESDAAALVPVLRAFAPYRTLLLTLERAGVRDVPTLAAALQLAQRLSTIRDTAQATRAVAQYQAMLVFIERASFFGAIDSARATSLVKTLTAVSPDQRGRTTGAFAAWLKQEILRVHGYDGSETSTTDAEGALLDALSGSRSTSDAPRVQYEGVSYNVDPAGAERERLAQVRSLQSSVALDDVLGLIEHEVAQTSTKGTGARPEPLPMRSLVGVVEGIGRRAGATDRFSPSARVIQRVSGEAARELRDGTASTAVAELADLVFTDVVTSVAYATALGDPEGPALMAGDVAGRHYFGGLSGEDGRGISPWSLPYEEAGGGRTWRVNGSLLGLDIALATLGLRRLEGDYPTRPPMLAGYDRLTLAHAVALTNPRDLTDESRDAIAAALNRGRQRVLGLAGHPGDLSPVAGAAGLDELRKNLLGWSAVHEPEDLPGLVTLTETFLIGGGDPVSARPWGTPSTPIDGCLCLTFPAGPAWDDVMGRPGVGLMASRLADISLRAAEALSVAELPARAARGLLMLLTQTVLDEVQPVHQDDRLSISRYIASVPREKMEDYIAALAYDGPLRPVRGDGPPRR